MLDPLMDSQVVMEISSLRDTEWERQWEKKLDLHWEAPLKECHARMRRWW